MTDSIQDHISQDLHGLELVIPKQITSTLSSIFRKTTKQQQTSLNQSDISVNGAGHPSRKKSTLNSNWFRKRKTRRKNSHDVQNTLGNFVEIGLATVVGNNVHDIYEVVLRCRE